MKTFFYQFDNLLLNGKKWCRQKSGRGNYPSPYTRPQHHGPWITSIPQNRNLGNEGIIMAGPPLTVARRNVHHCAPISRIWVKSYFKEFLACFLFLNKKATHHKTISNYYIYVHILHSLCTMTPATSIHAAVFRRRPSKRQLQTNLTHLHSLQEDGRNYSKLMDIIFNVLPFLWANYKALSYLLPCWRM